MLETTIRTQLQSIQTKTKKYPIKAIIWSVAIFLGVLQAAANRYNISSEDGISYLDIGSAYFRGDWGAAINAQWSPLYSWLLGLAIHILKPSPYWEFAVVKLVNFLNYLFALFCFDFFLKELRVYYLKRLSSDSHKSLKIPEWAWLALGYTLFLWASLRWISLYSDTPDMCTAALVYVASGLILRVHTKVDSWLSFIALGAALGFAYLSKTVMFPLAFVFLAVGAFSVGNLKRGIPRALAALLVFTVITAPFIAAISTARGHLTYGDTGKLNYAWLINPGSYAIPDHHWQGGPPENGTPEHPTRKLFDKPEVFEFATPVAGTYAPWYDPTYWYEGLKVKFSIVRQIQASLKNSLFYYKRFLGILLFVYLVLVCMGDSLWQSLKELKQSWRLLIPATAGLSAYLLNSDLDLTFMQTQPSTRLIAVFIVLLFAGVFSSVRLPKSSESKKLIAGMTIATLVIVGGFLSYDASKYLGASLHTKHPQWEIAEDLRKSGIQPGDRVAHLGLREYYWARLAKVKIVAEIPKEDEFWTEDAAVRNKVLETVEKTGAKAIVQKAGLDIPDGALTEGWRKISNTDSYVYLFKR